MAEQSRAGYRQGVVKLSSGGRVTIPAKIRRKLNLSEGDELRAEMVYGGVLLRVDSLANERAVRDKHELARLGWRGLWHSQVPIVQILGRGGLIAIVLLVLVVPTLAEKQLSELLTLLAAVNVMIIPIMRGEPPLTIGYFEPIQFGAWLEKRLSQPEITCATASLILIFSYFIAPFSNVKFNLGAFAILVSLAGLLVGSRRPVLSEYIEELRKANWSWRYHDRGARSPTIWSFFASTIMYVALTFLGMLLWACWLAEAIGFDGEHPVRSIGWVVVVAILVAACRSILLGLKSRTSIVPAGARQLISKKNEEPIGWGIAVGRAILNAGPLMIAYALTAGLDVIADVSAEEAVAVYLTAVLLIYGTALIVPIFHPGGRTASDIFAGSMPGDGTATVCC